MNSNPFSGMSYSRIAGLVLVIGGLMLLAFYVGGHYQKVGGVPAVQVTQATTTSGSAQTTSATSGTKSVRGTTHGGTTSSGSSLPKAVAPKIASLAPSIGAPGTQVTIIGTGFDKSTNYIAFGTSGGRHHQNGTADNVIATSGSSDGTTLSFTVPTGGPSGLLCDANNQCVGIAGILLSSGSYPVVVSNRGGVSNSYQFSLTR